MRRGSHACGACGARLFTARFRDSGALVHVETDASGGDLMLVPELPGVADDQLPHVARTAQRATRFREHLCPKAQTRSFSGAARRRKEKPA